MVEFKREILEKYFFAFKSYVEYMSGQRFISFEANDFLDREEGYKTDLFKKGITILSVSTWVESDIGTLKIIEKVKTALSLPENNLVHHQQKIHFYNVAESNPIMAEKVLYEIYCTDNEKQSFENAVALFGAKYDLIAYLYFLKNHNRFFPVRSSKFDKKFQLLGVPFKLSGTCSWENYCIFCNYIKVLKNEIESYFDISIRPIDAHSFLWMLEEDYLKRIDEKALKYDPDKIYKKSVLRSSLSRIGQGQYRSDLQTIWKNSCSVTGCNESDFLIASHIKPWCDCKSDNEWVNPYNGLLLTPNLDSAFDQGYISFADNGNIIISPRLKSECLNILGITNNMKLKFVDEQHKPFLEYHRKRVFK